MIITSACVCNISEHQKCSGERVSLVSQCAILRVALCQTHTDWPSAQNRLTYDLLAVILTPLPLSHHPLGIRHVCGPGCSLLSPTFPGPHPSFLFRYNLKLHFHLCTRQWYNTLSLLNALWAYIIYMIFYSTLPTQGHLILTLN